MQLHGLSYGDFKDLFDQIAVEGRAITGDQKRAFRLHAAKYLGAEPELALEELLRLFQPTDEEERTAGSSSSFTVIKDCKHPNREIDRPIPHNRLISSGLPHNLWIRWKGGVSLRQFSLYLMVLVYVCAGLNHFRVPAFYKTLIPPYLPAPHALVVASGVAEIGLALLLLWPLARSWAAWGIIALLIAVFPANIYMYQLRDGVFQSIPHWVLLLRLPLQALLVLWAYSFVRRKY